MAFCPFRPRLAQPVDGHRRPGRYLGEFLHRSLASRVFAVAVAAVFALACFRVASVPTTTTTHPSYRQDISIGDVFAEIQTSVAGMRRELLEQRATYTRMGNDTRALKERLATGN